MAALSQRSRAVAQPEILLVEDTESEARLFREALNEIGRDVTIRGATDAETALAQLLKRRRSESVSLPDLVFLDLHMPEYDGFELLEALRTDPALQSLPVIVLTGSNDTEDIARCYAAGATAYLRKPSSFEGWVSMAEAIEAFWFDTAWLPKSERTPVP